MAVVVNMCVLHAYSCAAANTVDASRASATGMDSSDYHCHECGRTGHVVCCDSCDRVFHLECIASSVDDAERLASPWYAPARLHPVPPSLCTAVAVHVFLSRVAQLFRLFLVRLGCLPDPAEALL